MRPSCRSETCVAVPKPGDLYCKNCIAERMNRAMSSDQCNCDESIAQKAKLRRVGLKLAEEYLRSIEPLRGEFGRGGSHPGDAHRRWAERWERVQRLAKGESL